MIGALVQRGDADTGALYAAQQAPQTFGDLVGSAYDDGIWNNRFSSQMYAERQAMTKLFDPMLSERESNDASFKRTSVTQESQQYYALKKSDALGGRFARNDREAQYAAMVESFKGSGKTVPTLAEVEAEAVGMAGQRREQFQSDLMHTVSQSPRLATFVGQMGAAFNDPVVLASVAGSVPLTLTRNVAAAAGAEMLINAGTEMVIQPQVQDWYQRQGVEYTNGDVATNIVLAGAFGAVFGGGLSAGYRMLGGQNMRLLEGPNAQSAILQQHLAGREAAWTTMYGVDKSFIGPVRVPEITPETTPAQASGFAFNNLGGMSGNLFDDMPVEWLWDPSSISTRTVQVSGDLPTDLGLRTYGEAVGMNTHLDMSNPWHHTVTQGTEYDSIIYGADSVNLDAAHRGNINDAIKALHNGEALTIANKEALSIELRVGQTTDHVFNVRQLIDDGVTLSLKNPKYRAHLGNVIKEYVADGLNKVINKVNIPADGKPVRMAMKAPRGDVDTLLNRAVKLNEDAKGLTQQINEAKKANKALEAKAKTADPDQYDWYLRQAQKNLRSIEQLQARRAKMRDQQRDIPPQVNALRKAQEEYKAEAARVHDINSALYAMNDLLELEQGRIPNRLKPLRARLDEAYQDAALRSAPKELEANVERMLELSPISARNKRGTRYDPNQAVINPLHKAEGEPIRNTTEVKAIREALDAAMERLPPDTTFFIDGEKITVKQQLEDFKIMDETLDGINVCAFGAPTV